MGEKKLSIGTIDKINSHYESIMINLSKGGVLSKEDAEVVKIHNMLHAKKYAVNSGKRTNKKHNNNW